MTSSWHGLKGLDSKFASGLTVQRWLDSYLARLDDVYRRNSRKLQQLLGTLIVALPFPYILFPYLTRLRFGCSLFLQGRGTFLILVGTFFNYFMAVIIINWLIDLGFLLWEKTAIFKMFKEDFDAWIEDVSDVGREDTMLLLVAASPSQQAASLWK